MQKICRKINISDSEVGQAFNELFWLIHDIEHTTECEEITLDFSRTTFVTPFFLLPLVVYLKRSPRKITVENGTDYMNIVLFPDTFIPEANLEPLEDFLYKYKSKTYIPIISFPVAGNKNGINSELISSAENMILRNLNIPRGVVTGIKYLIGEAVDNISEHSHSARGYMFMQYYPTKHYLDICIADSGISILGSYRNMPGNTITSDAEALQRAVAGLSTKNLPGAENRGYGISTSRNMLTKGLGGHYFLLSGNAFHISNRSVSKFVQLPPEISWPGTIIALRIPYLNKEDFNYQDYLE